VSETQSLNKECEVNQNALLTFSPLLQTRISGINLSQQGELREEK